MLKTVGFPSTRTGDQTIVDGNLVIGTAGKGIDFSADPSAPGMTSELLADYEEGTWTPTDASGAGLIFANTANNCFYTKIGDLVTCVFTLSYPVTADTSQMAITGLPFATKATAANTQGGFVTYTSTGLTMTLLTSTGGNSFNAWTTAGGSITNAQMSGQWLRGVIVYKV